MKTRLWGIEVQCVQWTVLLFINKECSAEKNIFTKNVQYTTTPWNSFESWEFCKVHVIWTVTQCVPLRKLLWKSLSLKDPFIQAKLNIASTLIKVNWTRNSSKVQKSETLLVCLLLLFNQQYVSGCFIWLCRINKYDKYFLFKLSMFLHFF